MTALATVLALAIRSWSPSAEEEVQFWAAVYGVDPAVALAVMQVESGQVREDARDEAVSRGNYGRFQVRCLSWRRLFGLRDCSELKDRHRNIRLGVRILRMFQDRFAARDGRRCRCRAGAGHHWVAHYNEGVEVRSGAAGERYANRVVRGIRVASRRSQAPMSARDLARPIHLLRTDDISAIIEAAIQSVQAVVVRQDPSGPVSRRIRSRTVANSDPSRSEIETFCFAAPDASPGVPTGRPIAR